MLCGPSSEEQNLVLKLTAWARSAAATTMLLRISRYEDQALWYQVFADPFSYAAGGCSAFAAVSSEQDKDCRPVQRQLRATVQRFRCGQF